ncbi:extracellular solute-binding protein [Paenibacillus ferrarius]|uniref:extracellular solute-binding protein n=1 Tax=Paenibacillus ferrarius TaxID=1469647 RepID=UPI003D2A3490
MKPKRATSRSRLEDMVATLRQDILNGVRAEGEFLPSELELGDLYTLSKNTVRKGLEVLVNEGFIEKVPRIGARIIRKTEKQGEIIRFGYYPSLHQETELLELVNQFNTMQNDIIVEPYPVDFPRERDAVETYLQEGLFDVITVNLYNYALMRSETSEKSLLEPFEPAKDIYPFLNAHFMENGQQYVLPFVFTPVMLCYNREHFRELQLMEPDSSWTWEDLSRAATQLAKGNERLGFLFHMLSENRWPIFLIQNGVKFERDEDGKINLHDVKIAQAFELIRKLAQEHFPYISTENDSDALSLFLNQRASMIMASYSNLNELKKADFAYDIAPLPHLHDSRTMLVVIGLAINKASARKPAAKTFVDFLLSYETQLHIRRHTLNLPGLQRAAEWMGEELHYRPYRYHMYREIVHTFRTYKDLNVSPNELRTIRQELLYYVSHLDTLEAVLTRLEEKLSL